MQNTYQNGCRGFQHYTHSVVAVQLQAGKDIDGPDDNLHIIVGIVPRDLGVSHTRHTAGIAERVLPPHHQQLVEWETLVLEARHSPVHSVVGWLRQVNPAEA